MINVIFSKTQHSVMPSRVKHSNTEPLRSIMHNCNTSELQNNPLIYDTCATYLHVTNNTKLHGTTRYFIFFTEEPNNIFNHLNPGQTRINDGPDNNPYYEETYVNDFSIKSNSVEPDRGSLFESTLFVNEAS